MSKGTKHCPKCKTTLVAVDDEFCYRDGTRLVNMPIHDCGRELGPFDKFCPKCGKDLTEETVTAEQSKQATERAERDAQLDADPEYKAWADSL
jgi:uncharacterized Zn finger protein (UPF0148 family)